MGLLVDGQSTVFAMQDSPAGLLVLIEKTITPSPADGRGPIDMTSLRNVRRTTKAPKQLVDFGVMKVTCFYDPVLVLSYNTALQFNGRIRVRFSDTSSMLDWGFMDKIIYHELKEGEEALCDVEFMFTGVPMAGNQVTLAAAGAFVPGNEILPIYVPISVGQTAAQWLAINPH